MKTLIHCCRLAILLFSLFGYRIQLQKVVKPEFTWGILYAGIGCCMFFAGLIGCLPLAAVAICLGGCCFAALNILKKQIDRSSFCFADLFFVFFCLYLTFVVYGKDYQAPDNFSHWATVLKSFIRYDRFPNASDTFVTYQSYPLGTASLLYYFIKIAGMDYPWFIMMAQNSLLIAMAAGLFAFSGDLLSRFLTVVFCTVYLSQNLSFLNLTVDTVLPVAAVAGVAYLFHCFGNNKKEAPPIVLLLYICFLPIIKTSGILFGLFLGICVFLLAGKHDGPCVKCNTVLRFLFILAPIMIWLLWTLHVKTTFVNGMNTRHAFSLTYLSDIFSQKTPDIIKKIANDFVTYEFSLKNGFWALFICMIVYFFAARFLSAADRSIVRCFLIGSIMFYIAYQIGTLAMYIFSMPTAEASVLACYERYHTSAFTFIGGVLYLLASRFSDLLCIKRQNTKDVFRIDGAHIASVICTICLCFAAAPHLKFYIR